MKDIITINKSLIKPKDVTEREKGQKEEKYKVQTFPVPFALLEANPETTFRTNICCNLSKEQIINQAFKFNSKGNIKNAFKYYKYFINRGFIDHRVFSNYGSILKDHGKLEEAELYFRKAIKIKSDFAEAHYNLGNILIDLGKLEEAELYYRKAIKIKPDFAKAHYNLGCLLRDIGKLGEAESSTRNAIEIQTNFADAHNNLGNILKDLGKQEEAEINYTKAIKMKPNFSDALINRWQLFFDQGKFNLALRDSDSCNTRRSRALSLVTLYALGNIDEIYKRIEATAELDSKNIDIAAFSSFLLENEKRDTANNFCKNPLSFLYFSNLKSHIKDYHQFIKEIIEELNDFPTIWQPRTTINGFQTPTTINLFSKPSKYISHLKSIILNEINSYYIKFKHESCLFIQRWPTQKNLVGWYNILKKQGYQEAHIHPSGWLSGVIYLKVVPPLDKDEGAIKFSLNSTYYSHTNSKNLTYQPKLGDIVFFPSSLHHRTIPFSTDSDRIVLAFDLKPF